jgi:hypothetical protein
VNPLGTAAMRKSFVNCSRGEAARINLPADLAALPWPDLDFAGWRDPKAPQRAYLVAPRPDGTNLGLVLRTQAGRNRRSLVRNSMCSICLTVHTASGVSLFAAPPPRHCRTRRKHCRQLLLLGPEVLAVCPGHPAA